eukprot:TRINITY_DN7915_c2_g1_i1.p1 TRINITY_DN7915_c2_g1~~TRINITY_DN7915_c2_g1_i1.p1  ORF type:complete len:172 (+),score=32.36 TRINITY_DN7915_c2_g1_i1:49-564(+)
MGRTKREQHTKVLPLAVMASAVFTVMGIVHMIGLTYGRQGQGAAARKEARDSKGETAERKLQSFEKEKEQKPQTEHKEKEQERTKAPSRAPSTDATPVTFAPTNPRPYPSNIPTGKFSKKAVTNLNIHPPAYDVLGINSPLEAAVTARVESPVFKQTQEDKQDMLRYLGVE